MAEYKKKGDNLMLTKENSDKLMTAIMERIDKMFPNGTDINNLANQIAKIAATVSVVTLQEYEKMNQ